MALADRRPGVPEPPPEVRGTWLSDELQKAQVRIDALTHSLETAQGMLRVQQEEIARLTDLIQTVDGRTQRHEAGQDLGRETRQQLAGMVAAVEAESSLRRDLAARVDRADEREHETRRELQRVLEQIAARLEESESRQASSVERERHLAAGIADQAEDDASVADRLLTLERETVVAQEQARSAAQEVSRATAPLPEILSRLDELTARMRAAQVDQQRMGEEIAAVRAIRDREEELLDVLEQQRATRARMEHRLTEVEEAMEVVRRAQADLGERLALVDREQTSDAERYRSLSERLEAQRDLLVEHARRTLRAEEDHAKHRIEAIEREARLARGLLVRLEEQSGEEGQETPL